MDNVVASYFRPDFSVYGITQRGANPRAIALGESHKIPFYARTTRFS